ncbi:MAG: hypothetical protein K6G88_09580 [Lachnospiraceae bacterium]|nr:hypothetical protein [Lachnospiraceae bacterium]
MANFFSNYGLDFLDNNEQELTSLIQSAIKNGNSFKGYGGYNYICKDFGDMELIVHTKENPSTGNFDFLDCDTHGMTDCVWNVKLNHVGNISLEDQLPSRKICMVKNADTGIGCAIIHIMNSDILPSYLPDDLLSLQMVGYPSSIHYYENDYQFFDTLEANDLGCYQGVALNHIAPLNFLKKYGNTTPGVEYRLGEGEDTMTLHAVVKEVYQGVVNTNGEDVDSFIRCIVDTNFGELEIAHTMNQVDKAERHNIKEGAIVSADLLLSGDVAIFDYQEGRIFDEKHHLMLLRSVFANGDFERLESVLSDECALVSEDSGSKVVGKQAIMDYLKSVYTNSSNTFSTRFITISDTFECASNFPYREGKTGLALSVDGVKSVKSILFIDTRKDDNKKKISKILITGRSGCDYDFLIPNDVYEDASSPDGTNEKPEVLKETSDTYKHSDNVHSDGDTSEGEKVKSFDTVLYELTESIISRSNLLGFLEDEDSNYEYISTSKNRDHYLSIANHMVKSILNYAEQDFAVSVKNMLGYLFAKSFESKIGYVRFNVDSVKFSVNDMLHGTIQTQLGDAMLELLEDYYREAMSFYNDFKLHSDLNNHLTDREQTDLLIETTILVQQIAELYAMQYSNI